LVVGGVFESAGAESTSNIASWDGGQWSYFATPEGIDHRVGAIEVIGSDLYAAGDFTVAGTLPVNYIARWDGSQWDDVGGGFASQYFPSVKDLALFDGDLIACGWFDEAGGVATDYIARWDGTSWSAVDGGFDNYVWSLAVIDDMLYAGGDFYDHSHIARLGVDGWETMGLGIDGSVLTMTSYNGQLYAGGQFTTAGGNSSFYIARWDEAVSAVDWVSPLAQKLDLRLQGPNPNPNGAVLAFSLEGEAPVKLSIFDLQGRLVETLLDRTLPGGDHTVRWENGLGGEGVSPGVYYAQLSGYGVNRTRKLLVIR
jgi:Domain of unknown function (DUF5122) beta-propeller